MTEREYNDVEQLTRLRMIATLVQSLIPFGAMEGEEEALQAVALQVSVWVDKNQKAVEAHADRDRE